MQNLFTKQECGKNDLHVKIYDHEYSTMDIIVLHCTDHLKAKLQ